MPPVADHDYTQVLGFDSQQPGFLSDHDGECGGGGRGNGVPGRETIPPAYGETQPVDSCGEQLGLGLQDWGETQVVDEFQETELVGNDDEDGDGQSERTELVTDVDDDFVGEVVSGIHAKDRDLVDPDASTDEEGGCCNESHALRSSRFAAARSMTCTPVGNKSESSNLAEMNYNEYNQDKVKNSHTGLETSLMETVPSSVSELNIVGTKEGEIVLNHVAENLFGFSEGDDIDSFMCQEKETTIRSEISKEKWAPVCPLGCSEAAVSYISSQEPGVQSQATALGVVDKFLSVIDVGLSQDINNGSTDIVISPPIANVKKVQSSVLNSKENTAGNIQVYDWSDSLEDGGELFSKKEDSSFDRKGNKKRFCNLPSGAICRGSEMIRVTDSKRNYEGAKSRACQKLARLDCFGSNLKPSSKTKSNKIHFNEMAEEQASTERVQQLKKSDDHTIDEGVYDVGPATQMAAEAIQALCHSSPLNLEHINLQSRSEELAGISTNIIKPGITCSRNTPTRKRSKRSRVSERIMARSKQQINITKSRTSCNSSRKKISKLGTKMVSEEGGMEVAPKMTKKKLNENCKGLISVSIGGSVASVVEKTMKMAVDKEVEKPSVGEKFIVGSSQPYTSPVAYRTRNSASKLLDFNKRLSNSNSGNASEIKFCGPRTVAPENGLAMNASVVPKVNKNVCDVSLNATANRDYGFGGLADAFEMERVHVDETGVSHDKDAYRELKRRKNNIDSENQTSDSKMENHSKAVDVIASKGVKLPVQRNKHRVFIRSIADIIDTVKRRRRSVSSSNKLESDGLASKVGNMPNASHMRTRSSFLSDILKPYLSNNSHVKPPVKPASDGTTCTYSVSSVKQVVHNDNPEKSKNGAQFGLFPEVAKEYIKPEGSPDAISQPSLTCSPTIGIHAVSPVSISQEISKLSARKSLSRPSLTRELIRLETTSTSPSKLIDMRRKKDMGSFQICFSNHLSQDVIKQQKKIMARLGIQAVFSTSEATHFVADKFVRTRNMLEAMAMGKPVVTPMWLESCGQASCYIDERNYILRDDKKEKEIGFSMPVSLARACQHPLLQGKMLFITQHAKPNQELISSLVKTAGGQVLKRITRSVTKDVKLPENLLILADEEDSAVCMPLLEKGAAVFSSELLLNGIVIQKLEYERHQLFLDQKSKL